MQGLEPRASHKKGKTNLDLDDLDRDERAVLAEVSRKGYYHARPKNGLSPMPQRIDCHGDNVPDNCEMPARIDTAIASDDMKSTASSAQRMQASQMERAKLALLSVLEAQDLYAMLRSSRSAAKAELRLCYIRTVVQVHPLRNPNPDAETAFCRASGAWMELCDTASRCRYDMELHGGRGLLSSSAEADTEYQMKSIDAKKARSVFACAVAECVASHVPAKYAPTVQCAQELAAQGSDEHDDEAQPTAPAWSLRSAASGLAMSAGLLAAGAAADAAGYAAVGACVKRAALCQGLTQCAMGGAAALQNASVQDGLSTVASRAQQLGSDVSCVARSIAGSGADSSTAAARTDDTHDGWGRFLDKAALCLQGSWTDNVDSLPELSVGACVEIVGLTVAFGLNGRTGEVIGLDENGRYKVRLHPAPMGPATRVKAIKRENLKLMSSSAAPLERSPDAPQSADDFM
eukprot:TRINITY_DN26295_c0_g1_i1.p1 TRINITY_DN26295_c0_g1~~TRINITY_DN26295_c0_g1_i1.p1  ORF type:complete len:474 (-),score=50.62 TRINITY_DN26295_c0_g1_i1:228-1610(-)